MTKEAFSEQELQAIAYERFHQPVNSSEFNERVSKIKRIRQLRIKI